MLPTVAAIRSWLPTGGIEQVTRYIGHQPVEKTCSDLGWAMTNCAHQRCQLSLEAHKLLRQLNESSNKQTHASSYSINDEGLQQANDVNIEQVTCYIGC